MVCIDRRGKGYGGNPKVVDVTKINDYTDLADPSLKEKYVLGTGKVLIINL